MICRYEPQHARSTKPTYRSLYIYIYICIYTHVIKLNSIKQEMKMTMQSENYIEFILPPLPPPPPLVGSRVEFYPERIYIGSYKWRKLEA